jgi:hypothetical protein
MTNLAIKLRSPLLLFNEMLSFISTQTSLTIYTTNSPSAFSGDPFFNNGRCDVMEYFFEPLTLEMILFYPDRRLLLPQRSQRWSCCCNLGSRLGLPSHPDYLC